MKKTLFFILFFILCLSSFIYAAPPFLPTETLTNADYTIEYPLFEYYPYNEDLEFEFHVFNTSGQIITNKTINCYFHLYNNNGEHIYQENGNVKMEANLIDFEVKIGANNFSLNNNYAYIFSCNDSHSGGGSMKTGLTITREAKPLNDDYIYTGLFIAFMLLFNFIIFWIGTQIQVKTGYGYMLKRFMYIAAINIFFLNFTIFKQIISDTNLMYESLINPLWYLMTFVSFAATIYLVYFAVIGGIKMMNEAKIREVSGEPHRKRDDDD